MFTYVFKGDLIMNYLLLLFPVMHQSHRDQFRNDVCKFPDKEY